MDDKILQFHWLSTGYCTALEAVSRIDGALKHIRFPARVGVLIHAEHGCVLFDTGYTQRFFEAARRWPYRLYALVTPVFTLPEESLAVQLKGLGIAAADVRHVLLSHFHADHTGGVWDFPNARFYCHRAALEQWQTVNGWSAVRRGILPDLFPPNFAERCVLLDENNALEDVHFGFKWEVFGDNSIEMVWLPGHGRGQLGARFHCNGQSYFLVADAAWSNAAFEHNIPPRALVRLFFDDWPATLSTLSALHRYHLERPEAVMLATHDEKGL